MKIARIEAFALRMSEGDSFGGHGGVRANDTAYFVQSGWRGVYSHNIETMVVRIETDTGLVGWGEGQSPIAPNVSAAVVTSILAPILNDRDPLPIETVRDELYDLMGLRGHTGGFMLDAIAAVDMALWDIKGKALQVPVHLLLGGPRKDRIPCYVSGIRGADDAAKIENLRSFARRGFSFFKLFAGFGVAEDIRLFRLLREAAGPDAHLAIDALWQYGRTDATALGIALEREGCAWFEAPVDFEDVIGHAALATRLSMPIAGGETERTRRQIWPWIEAEALDIVQPDIGRCGITEGTRVISLAGFAHRQVTLHCGIASPMMIAASLQVASACSTVWLVEYQPVVLAAANRLLKRPIVCEDGSFTLPQGPGLGIEVDESAIRRLAAA